MINREEAISRVATIIEEMESRYPERVIARRVVDALIRRQSAIPSDELLALAVEVARVERGFQELDYERACEFGDPNRDNMAAAQDTPIPTPLADRLRVIAAALAE